MNGSSMNAVPAKGELVIAISPGSTVEYSPSIVAAACAGGGYGVIARGMEAGGRVSDLSSFVLTQQLLADDTLGLPVWVCGGVGPRTAAACVIGGAAGVVLDNQLALMPECDLPDDARAAI